jgi:PGF-pre-PGF domain-containing protein
MLPRIAREKINGFFKPQNMVILMAGYDDSGISSDLRFTGSIFDFRSDRGRSIPKKPAQEADGRMKLGSVLLSLLFLLLVIPVSADHTVTFVNTCDQTLWINLQGGPKGVCNGVIDNNTHDLKKCSACSMCPANENTTAQLCNTSAATGTTDALCCPGIIQEQLYCWDKTQCEGGHTPHQCCPPTADNSTAGQSYNCPSSGETTGCGNTTMTPSQINALSGYHNPANGLSHVHCNGSLIRNGGFELAAKNGAESFMFSTGWQGAFYPRTNCSFDASGIGGCETGNCTDVTGKGRLQCGGAGSAAPVTKGEMNLDDTDDWYDVSWVDGFNIAMIIRPTQYDAGYQAEEPTHHCAIAGCNVGLLDFASSRVPSWDILKYPSAKHVAGILSSCNYYSNLPRNSLFNNTLWHGYCCPVSEGYVNDSSFGASCSDVPAGKTCKTCAGLDNSLFPFNQPDALPNSARLFFDTCPNAYAYTYNDTSALMTCRGNSTVTTNYTVTFSCPAPVLVPTLTQQPSPFLAPESPSGSGSESVPAAQISPGGAPGTLMDFIFNDYNQETGSSTTSDATIHHIHINLTRTLGETILRIEKNPGLGTVPELSGHMFTIYYRIESPHLQPPHVGSAFVEFSVKEDLLVSLGLRPQDIVLMRWDGTRWTELPVHFDYRSNGRAYFSATTPGFSYFVITNRVLPQAENTGTTLPPVSVLPSGNALPQTSGAAATHPGHTGAAGPQDSRAEQKNQSAVTPPAGSAMGIPLWAIGGILLLCVATVSGWYARRWWIRRQNPALFEEPE